LHYKGHRHWLPQNQWDSIDHSRFWHVPDLSEVVQALIFSDFFKALTKAQ